MKKENKNLEKGVLTLWGGVVRVAIHLLHGDQPRSIPVVANRHYNLYLNETILATTALQILPFTRFNAIKVQP